ncbi:chain length determinant family protein [Neiella sp. HB171785]|uniref:Chain length determinant family protein n=1 Tax=Neiella litorisoli TaxID=2771431 RepID=A0A8J6QTB1_9GAMM|nr:XrtA system polysaccharide chain length determinant [Neiella litorisoli]MBD1390529.1 chain length determinant family protein [Neiella litorisoli]
MQDLLDELLQYLRGVWLKRRYILIATWIICPIGFMYVSTLPNTYSSSARVFADTRSMLKPLLRGLAIQSDSRQELGLIVRTIKTKENIEKIARASDADLLTTNDAEYRQLLNKIRSGVRISGGGSQNMYNISFRGDDPKLAQKIVQGTVDVFIENTLGEKRLGTDQAQRFLDEQIAEYEQRLIADERRLADFRRDNAQYMVNNQGSYFRALENAKSRLEQAELELKETETELETAKKQLNGEVDFAMQDLSAVKTQYDGRIESLRIRLDQLLVRFTEKHPEVQETQKRLDSLLEQKRTFLSGRSNSAGMDGNPILQDLKATVNRLTAAVASRKVRRDQYLEQVSELQDKLDFVPEIEAQMTGLNRTYSITKDKYYQLLGRKESAVMSEKVEQSTEGITFRVLKAPSLQRTPSGPPRLSMLIGVLVASVGVGIALSVVFSLLSPIITSPKALTKATGLPIYGVVSATENSGMQRWEKKKTRIFIAANVALALLFAAFAVVNSKPQLHDLIFIQGLGAL